jgi:hypothetical protein
VAGAVVGGAVVTGGAVVAGVVAGAVVGGAVVTGGVVVGGAVVGVAVASAVDVVGTVDEATWVVPPHDDATRAPVNAMAPTANEFRCLLPIGVLTAVTVVRVQRLHGAGLGCPADAPPLVGSFQT